MRVRLATAWRPGTDVLEGAIWIVADYTTLRYVPQELRAELRSEQTKEYLNNLNRHLLEAIEKSGEAFISNAVIAGKYALRFCIVNFRSSACDI